MQAQEEEWKKTTEESLKKMQAQKLAKAESAIEAFRDAIDKAKDDNKAIEEAQNAARDALRNDLLAIDAATKLLKNSLDGTAEWELKDQLEQLQEKKKKD